MRSLHNGIAAPFLGVRAVRHLMNRRNRTVRDNRITIIVEIGLTLALAAVLNTVKVFEMPQGGTISLVMLPLIVLAMRRGPRVGVLAGLLYGVIDVMIDPFIVHWAQLLLDYPIAYGAVGLAGIFSKTLRRGLVAGKTLHAVLAGLLPGVVLAAAARYAAHVTSGVIFFAEFAEGQPVLAYSAVYNLYVAVSAVACFAAAAVLMPVLERTVPTSTGQELSE
jgi:thiamine transporter